MFLHQLSHLTIYSKSLTINLIASTRILLLNLLYQSHLIGNKIVDHLDVVGASPDGAAMITSSF